MPIKKQDQNKNINSSLFKELKDLWNYLGNRRRVQLCLLLVLMLLSSLSEMISLGAIFPFLSAMSNPQGLFKNQQLQFVFSFFKIETPKELVTFLAIGFVIAVIFANILRLITLHFRIRLAAAVGGDVSNEIYHKTLRQPYSFHVNHNSSELMQTVTGDTTALTSAILIPFVAFLNDALLVPALIGTLLLIDGKIAVGTTVVLGGAYIIIYRTRQRLLKRNSKVIAQAGEKKIKVVQEGIGGIRDVLLNHSQDFFEKIYISSERAYKKATATNLIISQSPKFFIEALALSSIALLAMNLGQNGDFSKVIPVLGSLALGAKRLLPALQEAFASLAKMQGSRAALTRVLVALQRPVNSLNQNEFTTPLPLNKEIRLENIWFSYGQETDWVLRDLNMTIAAKTTVGFVGSTGSGKSTTADLILGLLQPQKGKIFIDDIPLEKECLYQWQKNIAHVPQSIFLSDGSIAENIAFGISHDRIDLEQVRKASRLAQIDEFIEGLPAKYDTYVGERGIRLSGGQRQRIGIARALYGNASVIVFDEATSALDNATEREVMAAIESLSHQFTIILIAHRLSTVEKCDCIFELREGKLINQGNYLSLMEKSLSFQNMAKL
ncbi:ABC transporter ATP-binding protein [Geminocystis sp. NIES-3709]|uniref:ABC transporter ATP-binding protein n=1 Tax=Geminocystis sp. NIES-3709 TaxID=1617448 RepID=UPI0005FC7C9D|nr:ABC transporter ATP-binding protein [Geminocystis sp. NIES-3709]BAQ64493.1 phospholipid-lipopolysaccharide ABC transporter [Geminocystis sp. NIES-3709]